MRMDCTLVLILFFTFSTSTIFAQNTVVVIPHNSAKKLQNVVTVSKKGGDFTDPVAAVNSITDAAADNPYLVVIGPGVYTLTQALAIKPWGFHSRIRRKNDNTDRCYQHRFFSGHFSDSLYAQIILSCVI